MKRYNTLTRKARASEAQNPINRYYRTLAPLLLDENAQQTVLKDGSSDVTGFQEELCQQLEKLSLKDLPQLDENQSVTVLDVYELHPGYICIGRMIYVLVKERIAEIHPVTLRYLNITEPPAMLQCDNSVCIAYWCIKAWLPAADKYWSSAKDSARELRLSPLTGLHRALDLLTEDYFTNKGPVLSNLELYELLNAVSILSVQSYRRGSRKSCLALLSV
ncbi:hypothetical protein NDU88_004311 [Pleurodeles waltl]|uniref:Uncharacterized protein n=1 Tax=Pleurodeles waltl TaxID=8319 RepID=A0AAV7RGJ2_PLEWA|nr:hypothetical protein NDU88_004311 [Pleurodeles waltl]